MSANILPNLPERAIAHEAEQGLLSCMMQDENCIDLAAFEARADWFVGMGRARLFELMVSQHGEGEPSDLVTLTRALGKEGLDELGGAHVLAELLGYAAAPAHYAHYRDIVREAWLLRVAFADVIKVSRLVSEAQRLGDVLDEVEQLVYGWRGASGGEFSGDGIRTMPQLYEAVMEERSSPLGEPVATGLEELDKMLGGGLRRGEMFVLAARPGVGKTALALQVSRYVAEEAKLGVLFFTLEMSGEDLYRRMTVQQCEGSVSFNTLANSEAFRRLPETQQKAINGHLRYLRRLPVWVDDCGDVTAQRIRASARRYASRHEVHLVVVDYLGLVKPPESAARKTTNDQVAEIMRDLKRMAKELNVIVLLLCQLNRGVDEGAQPTLRHLRDSGAIEQDADMVGFLWLDVAAPDFEAARDQGVTLMEFALAKNRRGQRTFDDAVALSYQGRAMTLDERKF